MAILSNCRALRRQLPADPSPHGRSARSRFAAERAAHLTRQLLAFGRDADDRPVALDLGAQVQRTTALSDPAENRRPDSPIDILDRARDLRAVLGRSSELEQVIMNLVLNARDAMPDGGTVTITARNAPGDRRDPSRRGRHRPGHGRGDPRARVRAVLHHQGRRRGHRPGPWPPSTQWSPARTSRIDVTSAPGKGTVFSIWLPGHRRPPGRAAGVIGRARRRSRPADRGHRGAVEDDDQVRAVIRDILDAAGMHVIEARDGTRRSPRAAATRQSTSC